MQRRKGLPKSIRFEVFKRDGFKCQYCGRSSPDVILECDHIVPIAAGGGNDILNLVTACRDCNRGKGKRELSDISIISAQKKQLEDLNEIREQTEMMIKWKEELLTVLETQANCIESISHKLTGFYFTDYSKRRIMKLIKRFGFDEVYEAADIAFSKYYKEDKESTWDFAFDKIGGICYNRKMQQKGGAYYNAEPSDKGID